MGDLQQNKGAGTVTILFSLLWFFAAILAAYAGVTLLWPGTPLDRLWKLNVSAHVEFLLMGRAVGYLFLVFSAVLVAAGIGWMKHRRWGWTLGVVLLATQVGGDLLTAVVGDYGKGAAGVLIAGSLLLYILQPRLKQKFSF